MVDLLRRAYEPDDASALAGLLNTVDVHAGGHGGFTDAEMSVMITTFADDPLLDTSLLWAPGGDLVAAGIVLAPPTDGYRVELLGGVHPGWRGQELGREVLAAQLDRAQAMHVASGAAKDWAVHVHANTGDTAALRLFRRLELVPERYWFDMVAPTGQASSTPMPEGLRVATYTPRHEEAVYEAHIEAFRDHWGHQRLSRQDWTAVTVRSEDFLPDLSMLAFDGADLAGYVLSYREDDRSRLYIGHVGTRRPWRRRGVAGGLLGQVIAAAREAGYASAGLGVDADSPTGAVGVYERAGFSVESRSVTCTKRLPATGAEELSRPARAESSPAPVASRPA